MKPRLRRLTRPTEPSPTNRSPLETEGLPSGRGEAVTVNALQDIVNHRLHATTKKKKQSVESGTTSESTGSALNSHRSRPATFHPNLRERMRIGPVPTTHLPTPRLRTTRLNIRPQKPPQRQPGTVHVIRTKGGHKPLRIRCCAEFVLRQSGKLFALPPTACAGQLGWRCAAHQYVRSTFRPRKSGIVTMSQRGESFINGRLATKPSPTVTHDELGCARRPEEFLLSLCHASRMVLAWCRLVVMKT